MNAIAGRTASDVREVLIRSHADVDAAAHPQPPQSVDHVEIRRLVGDDIVRVEEAAGLGQLADEARECRLACCGLDGGGRGVAEREWGAPALERRAVARLSGGRVGRPRSCAGRRADSGKDRDRDDDAIDDHAPSGLRERPARHTRTLGPDPQ